MSGIDAGIRVGKYEVGRELGKGGFGILYVARDHELGRDIAIKFLRPEHAFKPTVLQRFLQEARAAARINHPGIVTVFESGIVGGTNTRADGTVYIAMELLSGETLAQKIKASSKVPLRTVINYGRQLASALGAAHAAGIVHRDLKPQNVFVVPDAAVVGGERIKVLDFGIAKLADDFGSGVQTHSMVMLGTPMYMSPEQCRSSAKVDARSDIYALGCILFEMVCGKPPFEGDSGELIAKHQLVAPPTARSVVREVPEPLDRLIAAMLAKSPDDRPQTMELVEDALAELGARADEQLSLGPETSAEVSAYAPTTEQPRAKTRGRLPLIAGGLGAAVFGVAIGLFTMCGTKNPPAANAHVTADAATLATTAGTDAAPVVPDAAPAPPAATAADIEIECQTLQVDHKWPELIECAGRLDALDPKKAALYKATAQLESTSEKELAAIEEAIEKKDKERAKKLLAKVDQHSVYRKDAETVIATGKTALPPATCDADMLKDKGMENVNQGQHAAALAQFEASLRCKNDDYVVALAFMAACNAQNASKAKLYWPKLTGAQQQKYKVMCLRNRINLE